MTFTQLGNREYQLAETIRTVINARSNSAPRSKQKKIGLSEVGEPCTRKLAYKMLDIEQTNKFTDPWASISGTAIHAWLADAFSAQPDRYLVEQFVKINDKLGGTCDLFDRQEKMVIDHKCVGASAMKSRKRDGMTLIQRVQINLYGLGMENAGEKVEAVALAFYPLGGRLDGMHTIVEPYNRQLALDAIERIGNVERLINAIDPKVSPENFAENFIKIPKATSYLCIYCPWYLPNSTDVTVGCEGENQ